MARPAFSGVNPASFLGSYLREGRSVRSFLRDFRAAGGAIGDATAYNLAGEIRAGLAAREAWRDFPTDQVPTGDLMTPWSVKSGRGFYTAIDYYRRDVGGPATLTGRYLYTSDTPTAPDEALAALYDDLTSDDPTDTRNEFEILGAEVANVFAGKAFT